MFVRAKERNNNKIQIGLTFFNILPNISNCAGIFCKSQRLSWIKTFSVVDKNVFCICPGNKWTFVFLSVWFYVSKIKLDTKRRGLKIAVHPHASKENHVRSVGRGTTAATVFKNKRESSLVCSWKLSPPFSPTRLTWVSKDTKRDPFLRWYNFKLAIRAAFNHRRQHKSA